MIKLKKVAAYVGIAAMSMALLAGCGGSKETPKADPKAAAQVEGTVTASGSTALLPLLKAGQEEFQKKNSKVTVNIAGGGSFTGQNQVSSGAVNIGNSDVPLQDSLKDKGLVEHLLVGIPFVFVANKDVTVDNLTQKQAQDILSGKITNWKEVGGKDQKITVIHRPTSSGSRKTIQSLVLGKDIKFTDNAVIQDSNGAVRAGIASTPGAIGYVDAAYADGTVKMLKYNGSEYSFDNVKSGKYTIVTVGRMFTKGQPTGATKAFIDFVTSADFQKNYAEKQGFVPLAMLPNK